MTDSVRHMCSALAIVVASATAAAAQRTHTTVVVGVGDAVTGQFLRDVQVRLRSSPIEANTDTMGQARLYNVRPGIYTLEARRLGYQVLVAPIEVGRTDSLEVVMLMRRVAAALDTVHVKALTRMQGLREFDERRARGLGQFITQAQLDSANGASLDAVLRAHIRGIRIIGDPGNGVRIMGSRPSTENAFNGLSDRPCWPVVYLDGVQLAQDTKGGSDISILTVTSLAGIEYYAPSEVPAQYRMSGSFSPATASEAFNPDLLGGGRGSPNAGVTRQGSTEQIQPSSALTGRTAKGTLSGPLSEAITSPACGVMLIWSRR